MLIIKQIKLSQFFSLQALALVIKMRFMSTIKQTILTTCVGSRRTCTYSFLQRTYSLMWQRIGQTSVNRHGACLIHQDKTPLVRSVHCHSPYSSCSPSNGKTDKMVSSVLTRLQYPPLLQSSSSCRHGSQGANLSDSQVNSPEDHRPKRAGELLKYTNLLRSPKQRFVLTASLARTIRELIWPGDSLQHETATIITANEGWLT